MKLLPLISLLALPFAPAAHAFTDIHLGFGVHNGYHSGYQPGFQPGFQAGFQPGFQSGFHDHNWNHDHYWHQAPVHYGYSHWRTGYWNHTNYGGRLGWWWVVGPSWHYYDQPSYPYPVQSSTTYVVENPSPTTIVAATVMAPPPQPVAPPPQAVAPSPTQPMLYYCASSNSYYPYVRACTEGWQQQLGVPAQ